MDGVIASWDNNGKVIVDDWDEPGIFLNKKLVEPVINKIAELYDGLDMFVILTAIPNELAKKEKLKWLKKHDLLDSFSNIYFA